MNNGVQRTVRRLLLSTVLLTAIHADAQNLTANAVLRLFQIRHGSTIGSGFALDVEGRQYLITARHVMPNLNQSDTILILKNGKWYDLPVTMIEPQSDSVDILALAPQVQLAPSLPLGFGAHGIALGEDMFILGYPYGKSNAPSDINRGFPFPAVKRCVLAAIDVSSKESVVLLLDGINNRGFSGGPAIFHNSNTKQLQVAGVVTGYLSERTPVYALDSSASPPGKIETDTFVDTNTGIILASAIEPIIEAIRNNPIGPAVK